MKRPLAFCAIFFCSGIIAASRFNIGFYHSYCCALLFLFVCLLQIRKISQRHSLIFVAVFLAGACCYKNSQALSADHIARFRPAKKEAIYKLKGAIISEPAFKNNKTVFIFKAEEICSQKIRKSCSGKLLVYVKGKHDCSYGQKWVLQGHLSRIASGRGANKKSYLTYLNNQGIYSAMRVGVAGLCLRLKQGQSLGVEGVCIGLKGRLQRSIYKSLPAVPASILDAMVLGEKKNIPGAVYKTMMKSGTVHILVVSGFNVGIVALIFALLLKAARIPRRARFYIALPVFLTYCLVTGASTPVVRATIMAIVIMFAYLVKRQADILNACCFAALLILAFQPRQVFDIGFQLSFASVLSLVIVYPAIKRSLRLENIKIRPLRFILDSILVSASAWLGTAGFIAYYFRMVSPVTVLANIFVVPLAALITLSGFGLVFVDKVCPYAALSFVPVNELLIKLMVQINFVLIRLPNAYFYLSKAG